MPQPDSKRVSRDRYDAVLFDLDGVVTDTASVHATCWKQMFDEYLQKRASQRAEAFRPFDLAADYRLYVDGKPRFDGVRDFLASRGIQLPEGNPDDPAEVETVCGTRESQERPGQPCHSGRRRRALRRNRAIHPSAPQQRVQNCCRHLESKLHGRAQGRQVGRPLRGAGRWQHDPGATSCREARTRYVLDGGKAAGG